MTPREFEIWYEALPPKQGNRVYAIVDPRHIGTLTIARPGGYCEVVWEETGWVSTDLKLKDLRRAPVVV